MSPRNRFCPDLQDVYEKIESENHGICLERDYEDTFAVYILSDDGWKCMAKIKLRDHEHALKILKNWY